MKGICTYVLLQYMTVWWRNVGYTGSGHFKIKMFDLLLVDTQQKELRNNFMKQKIRNDNLEAESTKKYKGSFQSPQKFTSNLTISF